MEDLKFLALLKNKASQYEEDTYKYLSNFILNNLSTFSTKSLESFAKETNTSKPTVIRFCNNLELSGFSELKFQVQNLFNNNLNINSQFNFKKELIDDNQYNKYIEIKNNSSKNILDSYINNKTKVNELIVKIKNAKTIYMFGMNLAYNISRNFAQRVRWLNKPIIHERDLNSIESYIDQISSEDIVIIMSLSGNSRYLYDIVNRIPKEVYKFGILGQDGKLTKICDFSIDIPQEENKMWDSYSIRGQCLIQVLDFIYMDLNKLLLTNGTD